MKRKSNLEECSVFPESSEDDVGKIFLVEEEAQGSQSICTQINHIFKSQPYRKQNVLIFKRGNLSIKDFFFSIYEPPLFVKQ